MKGLTARRTRTPSPANDKGPHRNMSQLFATTIAVLALVISIWQSYSTKIHNELSVLPALTIQSKIKGRERENGVFLSNEGMGPGIVKGISISLDDEKFDIAGQGWQPFFTYIGEDSKCFLSEKLSENSKVSASETIALLEVPPQSSAFCYFQLNHILGTKDIEMTIDYESIYGNKMSYTNSLKLNDEDVYLLNTLGIF